MSDIRHSGGRPDALIALRSGVASARFQNEVQDAIQARAEIEAPGTAQQGQVEPSAGDAAAPPEMARPLIRRLGRRLLRRLRPFALPILHRFHLRVAHAVDASPAIQQQTALLAELRSNLEELRSQIGRALDFQDGSDSIAARLARQEERLVGLQSLAVANLNAIASFDYGNGESDAKTEHLLDAINVLQQQQAYQRELIERIVRSRTITVGDGVLIRTSSGWLIVPVEDRPLIAAMAENGDALEPGTVQVVRAILSPGDMAVDVGSNVGAILLPMASAVGPSGGTVAIEPTPRCVDALRKTIAINGLSGQCHVISCAVGAQSGTATLHLGATLTHNSLHAFPSAEGSVEVPVETLDNLIAKDRTPALIKIDVEGAELDVLTGMRGIIDRSPHLALIVEFGQSHLEKVGLGPHEWLAAFEAHGFKAWSIDELNGRISVFTLEQIDGAPSVNLLMLRDHPGRWHTLRVD